MRQVKNVHLGKKNLWYVEHGTEGRLRCWGSVRVGEGDEVDPEFRKGCKIPHLSAHLVKRRWGMLASMATVQQREDTMTALLRSESGKT